MDQTPFLQPEIKFQHIGERSGSRFASCLCGPKFLGSSIVDASFIKSQWQAHFLQIFPLQMEKLPKTHESDRECFEKNWKGDSYTTYDQFMKEYYPNWR
jgi:hypothetical protein